MAKITRATQKLFGSLAGTDQIAKFGSLFAGSPARYDGSTITPAIIQALANFLDGWDSAAIGGNAPAIEDMNALFYLVCYQLAYVLQAGVPEWDSGTTYYIGSFASDGLGNVYYSITDDNVGNALSDTTNWVLKTNDSIVRTMSGVGAITPADGLVRMGGTVGYTATIDPIADFPVGFKLNIKNVSTNGSVMTVATSDGIDGSSSLTLQSSPSLETINIQKNDAGSWDII